MHRLTRKNLSATARRTLGRAVAGAFPDARPRVEQLCELSVQRARPHLVIKLYASGTFYVEAERAADVDRARALIDAGDGPPLLVAPATQHWIGSDEAGKGDYFGPLVVCAVAIDRTLAAQIDRLHVRDSKAIADVRIRALGRSLEALLQDRTACVVCMPEEYNTLMAREPYRGNLGRLLGALHARAINALVETIACDEIVVDKFGRESHVTGDLTSAARRLRFTMVPHGERDPGVAAASILARDRFLHGIEEVSDTIDMTLPKGASRQVERVARDLVRARGEGALRLVAKLHFKTTLRVLS